MKFDLYIMALLYVLAGLNHFFQPKFYIRIIPPFLPWKKSINYLSGGAEVLLGVLLVTRFQSLAAWGLIALLLAVFPANIYHLYAKGAGMKIPVWALWVRLPLQFLLIYWAYQYI